MTAPILAVAIFCIIATVVHIASIVIAILRLRRNSLGATPSRQNFPPVSLVRPLCGIDNYAADTLRSTFELDYPHYEILFCVASANDPVVPLVEGLMAEHPERECKAAGRRRPGEHQSEAQQRASRAGARRAMTGSSSPTAMC